MKIKVFVKRPDSGWYSTNISNTLENFQRTVGGFIEVVRLSADSAIICNEEGRLMELPYNTTICGVDFVGTIFLVGVDGEKFCDVPLTFRQWRELRCDLDG